MEVNGSLPLATLEDPATKVDVGKALIEDGLLLAEKRRERRLNKLVSIHAHYLEYDFSTEFLTFLFCSTVERIQNCSK